MNKDTSSPKIEILPEHIIDQIKAGEVLERPASLIKELIENSLDAASTEINIHLVENGLDLLSIEDNGHGMSFENLPYAFLRHATSKLKTYEDLYRLNSFGFRGEALASVAASARVTCTSQPSNHTLSGGKLIINGGAEEMLIPYQSKNHGTSLFIKDLFYNTPARLKFIKSKTSEKATLKKMLYSFILSNPQTHFSVKWDDKEKEIFKPVSELENLKRIEQVFVSKNTDSKIWHTVEAYQDYKVEVFFTPETHTTPQYRHHYLFANNRFFQDKSLHMTVLRTLEPIWRFGDNGHYVVKLTIPPQDLDVNVHPNKTQIKFLKSDIIYSLLVTALRNALKTHQLPVISPAASQSPFFTREENQSFDLSHMSYANQTSHNSSSSYSPQSISHELQSTSPIIGFVSPAIILLSIENLFYIASISKLMSIFFTDSLSKFIANEEVPGPLLISEPFKISKGKIDSHFEDLKNLGFELDRLNPEVIVLRTFPRFVPQNISREITLCLIHFFEQAKITQYESQTAQEFIKEYWPTESIIPTHTLNAIITEMISDTEKRKNAFVLLEDKNLKKLL